MVTYCVPENGRFSTMTGHGIPDGMVRLRAGMGDTRCERYDEVMTYEEAQAEGIRQGCLVEFRKTESFWHLAETFRNWDERYDDGRARLRNLCHREELDYDEVVAELNRRRGE